MAVFKPLPAQFVEIFPVATIHCCAADAATIDYAVLQPILRQAVCITAVIPSASLWFAASCGLISAASPSRGASISREHHGENPDG